ncbi:MAG: hypothetical protein WDZ29_06890 [Balneolaceae bacterium]
MSRFAVLFLFTGLLISQFNNVSAQVANNPMLYSYQAVQFSDRQVSHDPVTLVMPGTAMATGFASYFDNPASAALHKGSFGSLGMVFRNVNEEALFNGRNIDLNDNQISASSLGLVYSLPVVRGSLVFGAGYSQHSFYNRAVALGGRNERSTMTDFFKIPGSMYEDMAFNAWAIDWGDEDETYLDSVFRIGFPTGDWPGITQHGEIIERGYSGEYSAFVATELVQNLMVGLSVGLGTGRHRLDRTLLEVDRFNDYDGDFIETDDGGTDIDTILLRDDITNSYYNFTARVGAIYNLSNHIGFGASFTFPGKLQVDETFDASIRSSLDNGVVFEEELAGEYSYGIEAPSELRLGLAVKNVAGFTASLSAEYVDFGKTRLDFDTVELEQERNENDLIQDSYRSVWNLRGGLAKSISDEVVLRGGYRLEPSRFQSGGREANAFTGGISIAFSPDAHLDVGAQFSRFSEESLLYEFEDQNFELQNEMAERTASQLQLMATLRIFLR